MRRSIDDAVDAHPAGDDDEKAPVFWKVGMLDDCESCADLRVEVVLEEVGRPGAGVTAHLDVAGARRLRVAVADALRELGEEPGR